MAPLLVSWWIGCTVQPVFNGITEIVVHTQTAGGTALEPMSGEKLERAKKCMYETVEIRQEEASPNVIQEIILVQVVDRLGSRMFEFYTQQNFGGNKGKYYRNTCMYRLIKNP